MGYISLGLTLGGAIMALIAGFGFHSIEWSVAGIVISIVGILFRPRNR